MISELIKGYWLTLRHCFRRSITVEYPDIRREPSPGYRGLPALRKYAEDGRERCVACALCVRICPAGCIEMTTETGPDGKKRPVTYSLDIGRCLFCGLCAEVCPEEAIVLSGRYEIIFNDRRGTCLDKDELLKNGEGQ